MIRKNQLSFEEKIHGNLSAATAKQKKTKQNSFTEGRMRVKNTKNTITKSPAFSFGNDQRPRPKTLSSFVLFPCKMKDPYVIAIHHERWKAAAAKDMK